MALGELREDAPQRAIAASHQKVFHDRERLGIGRARRRGVELAPEAPFQGVEAPRRAVAESPGDASRGKPTPLAPLRHALVQPCRRGPARGHADQNVRQLVREHGVEPRRLGSVRSQRHANLAVEETRGPVGSGHQRKVVATGVKHDDLRRVEAGAQQRRLAAVGALERDRRLRQGPFRDGDVGEDPEVVRGQGTLAAGEGPLLANSGQAGEALRILAAQARELRPGVDRVLQPMQAVVDVSKDTVDLGWRSGGARLRALQVETRGLEILGSNQRQRQLRQDEPVSVVEREGLAEKFDGAAWLALGEAPAAQRRQSRGDLARGGRAGRDVFGTPMQLGDRAVPIDRILPRQSQHGEQRGGPDQETVNGADAWRAWPVAASWRKIRRPYRPGVRPCGGLNSNRKTRRPSASAGDLPRTSISPPESGRPAESRSCAPSWNCSLLSPAPK